MAVRYRYAGVSNWYIKGSNMCQAGWYRRVLYYNSCPCKLLQRQNFLLPLTSNKIAERSKQNEKFSKYLDESGCKAWYNLRLMKNKPAPLLPGDKTYDRRRLMPVSVKLHKTK